MDECNWLGVTKGKIYIHPINPIPMKGAIYSIADEEFATLLARVHGCFGRSPLGYAFVGGAAVQAHIAKYVCKQHSCSLQDLVASSDFRVQDHLRATDDVDITVDPRKIQGETELARKTELAQQILTVQKAIAGGEKGRDSYLSPSEKHLVEIVLQRTGLSRPIYRLGLNADADDPAKSVSFNFYSGPEDTNERWPAEMRDFERRFYFDFMDRAQDVTIPYAYGKELIVRAKNPEDLLATKIARARNKDWGDVIALYGHSLQAGLPINVETVRGILCAEDPRINVPNLLLVEKFEKFAKFVDLPVQPKQTH